MTFRRTSSGLSNLHLFVDVEAVVFLEGGSGNFTRDRVEAGEFTPISSDIRFWQTLFTYYLPGRKFQFRSVGSKETVKSIALDIQCGMVRNVIAVMDRDFDNLGHGLVNGDNIIYTCGYSWENDCWSKETITSAVISLTGLCATNFEEVDARVNELLSSFLRQVRNAVKADSLMLQNGVGFFDRKSPARYIIIGNNGKPELCLDQVKRSFAESRNKVSGPIYRKYDLATGSLNNCFGHLLAYYSYQLLVYMLKHVYKFPTIAKDHATAVIVEKFISEVRNGKASRQRSHYDRSFTCLTVSNT